MFSWGSTSGDVGFRYALGMPDDGPSALTEIRVGQPWPGDPLLLAQPGFGWHGHDDLLLLAAPNLTPEEKATDGPVDVAVIADGPLVGLLVRPHGWQWLESLSWRPDPAPSPHLLIDDTAAPEARVLLTLVIVDQATTIVEKIRSFTLSAHASRILRREVRARWSEPIAFADGAAAMERWYAAHPTSEDSLRDSLARCKSGD